MPNTPPLIPNRFFLAHQEKLLRRYFWANWIILVLEVVAVLFFVVYLSSKFYINARPIFFQYQLSSTLDNGAFHGSVEFFLITFYAVIIGIVCFTIAFTAAVLLFVHTCWTLLPPTHRKITPNKAHGFC